MKQLTNFLWSIFKKVGRRKRFIFASVFLTGVIFFTTFLTFAQVQYFIVVIGILAYFLTYFSILDGIEKKEWLMLFLLPVGFTLVYGLFYFFLPSRWIIRIPYVVIYAIVIYAILLSSNIFNVGVEKSLQLFKAAFSVNFLVITITSFLVFNLVLSFRLNFIYNFILFFLAEFPLSLQFLWTVNPKTTIEKNIIHIALLIALIIAEIGMIFSFIPLKPVIFSLLLTGVSYSLGGLFQAYLQERLFKERIREFVFVLIFVFIITILSINW